MSKKSKYPELELIMKAHFAKLEISWWEEGGLFVAELTGACPIFDDIDGRSIEEILQQVEGRIVQEQRENYYDEDNEAEMDLGGETE